jgi:hypothetical protein
VTWPEMIFHIQIANASQAPAQYWIAQGGPGVGELAPYAPIPAISPTVPAAAPSTPAPASAAAGQTPSGGAPAQGSQPPQTLPVTGGATLIPVFGAGLALIAAGRRARAIAAWPVLHKG